MWQFHNDKADADVDLHETDLASSLEKAIKQRNLNFVRHLLNHNADINHEGLHGNTPLHFAIDSDQIIFDLILQYNPNVNVKNRKSQTPFIVAAKHNNYHAVKKLLEHNANIHDVDRKYNTALHLICRNCKYLEIVKLLLEYHANVNEQNDKWRTPLHLIVANKGNLNANTCIDIIQILLEHNAQINSVDTTGCTPLTIACKKYNKTLAKFLLKNGADINVKNIYGRPILHNIADTGDSSRFKFLLELGADINILSNSNKSVFHYIKQSMEWAETKANYNGRYKKRWHKNNNMEDVESDKSTDSSESRESSMSQESIGTVVDDHIEIYKLAMEHIIKLHCANLNVIEENLNVIYSHNNEVSNNIHYFVSNYYLDQVDDIDRIKERCEHELENLKCKSIGSMTLYDILVGNIHDVAALRNNAEVISAIESDNFKHQFPLYADIIKNRFAEVVLSVNADA